MKCYPWYIDKATLTTFIGIGDKIRNPQNEDGQSGILYVIDRVSTNSNGFGGIVTLLCSEDKFDESTDATRVKFTNYDYPEVILLDCACN